MKPIVVPLDGSALAEQALPYAQHLAAVLSTEVQLLHVITDADRYSLMIEGPEHFRTSNNVRLQPEQALGEVVTVLEDNADNYLEPLADRLRSQGTQVTVHVMTGQPAESIVTFAAQHAAAMIVMVTHGYSGLRRWTLGSVTDRVVSTATTPVFVVRGSNEPRSFALNRIMVTLDGSELARRAIPIAADLARKTRAELFALTVATPAVGIDPGPVAIGLPENLGQALREQLLSEVTAVDPKLSSEVKVTPVVTEGFAAEAIIDTADSLRTDLIVMATHGYSGLRRWALGSVADKVLHATNKPVLLFHVREE
jgi:nucleotide-binding universal stress UspA family protein